MVANPKDAAKFPAANAYNPVKCNDSRNLRKTII